MKRMLKGLYVITDKKLIPRDRFADTVEEAIRGGASVVQLREKDTREDEVIEIGKTLLGLTRKYGVPLIINDSAELARVIGADGVHLGEDDPMVAHAREVLGRDKIIGVSCYGKIERGINAERDGADYVAFGTPFFTPTKPERTPTSFDVLKEAVSRIKSIPIFAIGGITPENAESVLETGVDGIAVITAVFGSGDPGKAAREIASIAERYSK
ncbi:MAG TPA: thiamine phosphate synthase [Thermodesulfobacteriota bacterium]|nr:thiamine phosphate synthase [Thermodesulfobacteriota bacterium]